MKSYAKINLGLNLLRKRPDGYHDIATIFQQIDLFDMLIYKKVDSSLRIVSKGVSVPEDRSNLVARAFHLLQKRTGFEGGLHVQIQKTIPVGGGLGGGSSNAATTLTAVNRLWRLGLSRDDLAESAVEIGADVPFFLLGGTALGEGKGEILTPLPRMRSYWIVLVCSKIQVDTTWAYGQVKMGLTKAEKLTNFRAILENCAPEAFKNQLNNEFEGVVFKKHPELKKIKEALYSQDAFFASLTGSGSTIYGLFFTRDRAKKALLLFNKKGGLNTFLTKPL